MLILGHSILPITARDYIVFALGLAPYALRKLKTSIRSTFKGCFGLLGDVLEDWDDFRVRRAISRKKARVAIG